MIPVAYLYISDNKTNLWMENHTHILLQLGFLVWDSLCICSFAVLTVPNCIIQFQLTVIKKCIIEFVSPQIMRPMFTTESLINYPLFVNHKSYSDTLCVFIPSCNYIFCISTACCMMDYDLTFVVFLLKILWFV